MTIRDFYRCIHGDYEDALQRLLNEALMRRFVKKFPADPSFAQLREALEEGRYEDAFRAAHNLKGVCLNLSFTRLAAAAGEITELLRPGEGNVPRACEYLPAVEREYELVLRCAKELE